MDWLVAAIGKRWQDDLAEVGCPPAPPADVAELVDAFVDQATRVLEDTAPEARFEDAARVLSAEERLGQEADPDEPLDVATVVNAAWQWRIRHRWDDPGAVVERRRSGGAALSRLCRSQAREDRYERESAVDTNGCTPL